MKKKIAKDKKRTFKLKEGMQKVADQINLSKDETEVNKALSGQGQIQ